MCMNTNTGDPPRRLLSRMQMKVCCCVLGIARVFFCRWYGCRLDTLLRIVWERAECEGILALAIRICKEVFLEWNVKILIVLTMINARTHS